ncbi:lysyl-tRNA synthetase [Ornithinimicrobium sp. F0845]|uniref:lysyl-tRNA synthetase n=1 Tax=Ornithinimicrobium sp. F0845 TaxID=2926412 RepID=UPI001FF37D7C|nr:lysyl-tRNA synthetase [Ornithinimicrobium sp. F0845]MCK0113712.1 lysyl-tRNA synthetase [Ornithinimicrobium sp. F0845]
MALWDTIWPIMAALIPSVGLLLLFFFLMKRIVEADRRERAAERRWQAEREAMGGTQDSTSPE